MKLERLINRHKDSVYRQLYRMCGNHEDAEDVLAESFLKAHRAMANLENEEAFHGWLVQIARRTCWRLKKKDKLRPVLTLAGLEELGLEPSTKKEDLEQQILEGQLRNCILEAFDTLPLIYAEVYKARDLEGLSAEETARSLGLTVAAVKSRLHRARALIRQLIDGKLGAL